MRFKTTARLEEGRNRCRISDSLEKFIPDSLGSIRKGYLSIRHSFERRDSKKSGMTNRPELTRRGVGIQPFGLID